jgi:hypothetical protein
VRFDCRTSVESSGQLQHAPGMNQYAHDGSAHEAAGTWMSHWDVERKQRVRRGSSAPSSKALHLRR